MSVDEESIGKLIVETPLRMSNNDGTFSTYKRDDWRYVVKIKKEDGSIIEYVY